MSKGSDKWLNTIHKTKLGSEYRVISYNNYLDATVQFLATGNIVNVTVPRLLKGNFADWLQPKIFGVGFLGLGDYSPTVHKDAYHSWWQMINRCYNENDKGFIAGYNLCSVDELWHNFQNFAPFYLGDRFRQDKWHLDKDILIPGNKIYSKDTCVFLPVTLNSLLAKQQKPTANNLPQGVYKIKDRVTNKYQARIMKDNKNFYLGTFNDLEEAYQVYKREKEAYIRSQALVWEGKIDPRAIESLNKWTLPDWKVQ